MKTDRARFCRAVLLMASVSSPVMAQDAPAAAASASAPAREARLGYASVAEARAALEAMDGNGAVVTHTDGWMIVNQPLAAARWTFTPAGHAAYPAVVRRMVKRPAGGAASVETVSLCEAAADACAKLQVEFENLNDRVSQAIRARARQGSTPPPR